MKKILVVLFCSVLVVMAAFQRGAVMDDEAVAASTTNTAVANIVMGVQATSAVWCAAVTGTTNANFTNAVGFTTEKSYDNITWTAMTNFTVTGSTTNKVTSNIALTLGDYYFVRVAAVTNNNASAATVRLELISK